MTTAPTPDPLIGTTIAGRYEVTRKLNQGGMGGIYLATQHPLGRSVVLKVLLQSQAQNQTAILRFEKEARSVSKLVHPHIVSVFDFGQTQTGASFIAMEHLPGRSLRELLVAEGSLAPNRALHIVRGIVSGLGEAHRNGIIHRDLKPENIVLVVTQTDPDFPKILDFGVAKTLEENDVNITKQDVIPGTPTYIAPERLQGDGGDERSDIYSLGAMWYELVTGRPPFQADTSMRVIMMHLQQVARRPTEVRPDVKLSADLEHLMMRMLAKDPADRPPNASALLDLFAEFAAEPWTVQSARDHANSNLPQAAFGIAEVPPTIADVASEEIEFSAADSAREPTDPLAGIPGRETPAAIGIEQSAPILLDTPKTEAPVLLTRKKAIAPLPEPGVASPITDLKNSPLDEETIAVPAAPSAAWSEPATTMTIEDARLVLQEVSAIEQVASTMVDVLRSDFDRVFILDRRAERLKVLGASLDLGDDDAERLFAPVEPLWALVNSGQPFYGTAALDDAWRNLYVGITGRLPGATMVAALARDGKPALVVYAEHDRPKLDAKLESASALFEMVAGALTAIAF